MASLYIKDDRTTQKVRQLAKRLGTTQTEAVRRGIEALERQLEDEERPTAEQFIAWLDEHRARHPLPPQTGKKADKAFFDRMWNEPE